MSEKNITHIDFSWFKRINWPRVKDNVVGAVATGLFTGFSPVAPGTVGSLLGAVAWWFLMPFNHPPYRAARQLVWLAILFGIGVYAAGEAEKWWGRDHKRIVIDEVFGMCFSLMFVPRNIWLYLAAFLVFRAADIVKFYPTDRAEKLPGGWGVMTDDLLAGVYTGLIMQCVLLIFWEQHCVGARFILYALALALSLAFIYQRHHERFLAAAVAILGALAYWRWFPFSLLWQLVWIVILAGLLWWGARYVSRRWKIDVYQYGADKLIGIWLLLWFIPRIGLAYAVAAALLPVACAFGPWPARLVRARWPQWAMLLDDVIAAVYASVVLQTVVLIFWYDEMVPIKYIVLKLLGAL